VSRCRKVVATEHAKSDQSIMLRLIGVCDAARCDRRLNVTQHERWLESDAAHDEGWLYRCSTRQGVDVVHSRVSLCAAHLLWPRHLGSHCLELGLELHHLSTQQHRAHGWMQQCSSCLIRQSELHAARVAPPHNTPTRRVARQRVLPVGVCADTQGVCKRTQVRRLNGGASAR
jgi:hypothetical protein